MGHLELMLVGRLSLPFMMLYFNWLIGFSARLRSGLVAGWFIDLILRAAICS
jgi:hypothetical protein